MDGNGRTLLGPGPRLGALAAALGRARGTGVGPGVGPGVSPGVSPVGAVQDLAEGLVLAPDTVAWLVLDLAATPLTDLGLVRRLRARHAGLQVLWTGDADDVGRLMALAGPKDPFRPWPLDITTLPGLEPGAAEVTAAPAAAPSAAPPVRPMAPGHVAGHVAGQTRSRALDPDLGRIEAILAGFADAVSARPPAPASESPAREYADTAEDLAEFEDLADFDDLEGLEALEQLDAPEGPAHPHPGTADGPFEAPPARSQAGGSLRSSALELDEPLLSREELEAFFDAPEPAPAAAPRPAAPQGLPAGTLPVGTEPVTPLPRWYRDQVADLADLVQRAELASHAAAEGGAPARAALDGELARLRQFVRTLGCVAAPPSAARTPVDVAVLVEETLASLAQRPDVGRAGRPRFLFRGGAGLVAHADKGLLAAALDALLVVAAEAGGPDDVVRAEVRPLEGAALEVRVDFPAGRLAGLAPAAVLEPYALRARLPQVGPNALAAAGGIFVGHGGDLALDRSPGERFVFRGRLPRA